MYARTDLNGATDDAMLVEAEGGRVLIHPGPATNLKVTTPRDLRLAELLLDEGLLVKETAARLGFADAFQFSRAFKRVHGVPPTQLLEARRRNLEATAPARLTRLAG